MFCHLCGKEDNKKKNSKNEPYKFNLFIISCNDCRPCFHGIKKKPDLNFVFCVFCGTKIYWVKRRPVRWTCEKCFPISPKQRAHSLNQRHPNKIKVIRKCDCVVNRRVKHHPDYNNPFEVEDLCYPCHMKEHIKMNGNNTATHTTS